MTLRILCTLLLAGTSLSACAQSTPPAAGQAGANEAPKVAAAAKPTPKVAPGSAAERAMAALKQLSPDIVPEHLQDAPIPGFQQAIVGGQVLYISDDGKYLLQGTLLDIQAKKDLGAAAMSKVRRDLISTIPMKDRIVFAPKDPKYTVVIFTDIECGYCRKLHSEMDAINRQGIAVQYLAFPRMGPASEDFRKMEAVWCAGDRNKALTDAKNDRKVAAGRCTNPVAMQYNIGMRAGLGGTPMILAEDGTQLGGYLPPAELRAALDKLAGEARTAGTGSAQGGGI